MHYHYDVVTWSEKLVMPRGGHREGAGGKPTWISGKTKVIRVPEALADKLLELARILDESGSVSVSAVPDKPENGLFKQKVIDLSGISIRQNQGAIAVHLEDLVRAGFEIHPPSLARIVQARIDRVPRG